MTTMQTTNTSSLLQTLMDVLKFLFFLKKCDLSFDENHIFLEATAKLQKVGSAVLLRGIISK